jgi:phage terminase small subunit
MLTEKQEKFAQAYVLNNNATDAAKSAGYSDRSAYNQGYRLLQNDLIVERIEELSRELKTSVDVVAEIEDQYTFAKTNGHTNSAIKALELLSRVRGNKVEDGKNISKEELINLIVSALEVLGKEQVDEMVKRCKFD